MRKGVILLLLGVLVMPAQAARQPLRAKHGMVGAMEMALTKYGTRTWADDMAPSLELAGKGFPVSYALAEGLKGSKSLATSPDSKRIFQKNGEFFAMGDTLAQPELAQTLTRI